MASALSSTAAAPVVLAGGSGLAAAVEGAAEVSAGVDSEGDADVELAVGVASAVVVPCRTGDLQRRGPVDSADRVPVGLVAEDPELPQRDQTGDRGDDPQDLEHATVQASAMLWCAIGLVHHHRLPLRTSMRVRDGGPALVRVVQRTRAAPPMRSAMIRPDTR